MDHRRVTFQNRYGIILVGDLYLPKGRSERKLAAVAVSGPLGTIKEQSSGLYTQALVEQGFIALSLDPSYTSGSDGYPRNMAPSNVNTEDFGTAVDFLSLQREVDRNRIDLLGIRGWGGMALNDAAIDTRIKVMATSAIYDMSRAMGHGIGDGRDRYTTTGRRVILQYLSARRRKNAANGTSTPSRYDIYVDDKGNVSAADRILPETLPANPGPVLKEFFDCYHVLRGFHACSVNSTGTWNVTMPLSFMNVPLLSYASEVTTSTLTVAGEQAHSRYFTEDAFKTIGSREKVLVIVPDTDHVDLYDNVTDKIPFATSTQFFKTNLQQLSCVEDIPKAVYRRLCFIGDK